MYVLTLPVLRKMLHTAAIDLKDNVQYLCELDGVAGDGETCSTCASWTALPVTAITALPSGTLPIF